MSFFTWLFKSKDDKKEKRNLKGVKRIYDRGYRDGWAEATKRLKKEEFDEGKAAGWKEAMSTIANMADQMLLRPKNK